MRFGSYLLQKVTTTTEDNLLDISQPPFFFHYEQDESSYELQIQSCLYGEQLDISLTISMCPEPISTILDECKTLWGRAGVCIGVYMSVRKPLK